MKNDWTTFMAKLIVLALGGLIFKLVYDAAAYEFNLPTFSYWWHLGTLWTVRFILKRGE